jgi:2-oxoglutarate ferredoxin oxidoreductase subunit delta
MMTTKKKRGKIIVDKERCKGCQICISACPQNVIRTSTKLNQKGYYPAECIEPDETGNPQCTGCTMCAIVCPEVAIEVYRE